MKALTAVLALALLGLAACGSNRPSTPPLSGRVSSTDLQIADSLLPVEVAYEREPELVSMKDPEYPESARKQGIEGTVLVRVLVGEDGQVHDMIVIQSVPVLDESARNAARSAVFKPALKKDRPVAVWIVVPIEFRLHPVPGRK